MKGDEKGSEGAISYFQGRIIVMNGDASQNEHYDLDMLTATTGTKTVEVTEDDKEILFVVIAMPEFFKSHQTYGYFAKIEAAHNEESVTCDLEDIVIERNNQIDLIKSWGPTWEISFDFVLNSFPTGEAGILHFTTGEKCCDEGSRIPFLQVSNYNQLYILNAVNGNGNNIDTFTLETARNYAINISQKKVIDQVEMNMKLIDIFSSDFYLRLYMKCT